MMNMIQSRKLYFQDCNVLMISLTFYRNFLQTFAKQFNIIPQIFENIFKVGTTKFLTFLI